ncbi:MAG: SCP2 sterol-binding domain-containing protein [Chloroflexi bacterium]|nr:MAG: SCP2 sterol-binding domain-containing protein [Chloroflexota bacterium]
MPQSRRSTSSPSANRNTLTKPSSNGMGRRSSNTPSATSLSAISTTFLALSLSQPRRSVRASAAWLRPIRALALALRSSRIYAMRSGPVLVPPSSRPARLAKMAVSAVAFAQEERMSEVQMSPDQIVEAMPRYLIPEKAGGTKATIVFDLSGEHAGKWWVKIHDGAAESGKGDPPEAANLTLQADSGDWVKIMTGAMDGTSAFMQGKLKIKGDMGLAIKMQTLFKRP